MACAGKISKTNINHPSLFHAPRIPQTNPSSILQVGTFVYLTIDDRIHEMGDTGVVYPQGCPL